MKPSSVVKAHQCVLKNYFTFIEQCSVLLGMGNNKKLKTLLVKRLKMV